MIKGLFCCHGNKSTILLFYSIFSTSPEVSSKFTLLKYVKSQRSYGFLITKDLIFGFRILDLKDHFSASLNGRISWKLLVRSRNQNIQKESKWNRYLRRVSLNMMYKMSRLRHRFSNEPGGGGGGGGSLDLLRLYPVKVCVMKRNHAFETESSSSQIFENTCHFLNPHTFKMIKVEPPQKVPIKFFVFLFTYRWK